MKIIGLAKSDANGNQNLIVSIKEVEADKITGVAGKQHIPHRYKADVDVDVPISKVFASVSWDALKAATADIKAGVENIENSLPLDTQN